MFKEKFRYEPEPLNLIAFMWDGLELAKFIKRPNGTFYMKVNPGIDQRLFPILFSGPEIETTEDIYDDVEFWCEERVFPPNRMGKNKLLKILGLKRYNHIDIVRITRASMMTDGYWLVLDESDTFTNNTLRGKMNPESFNSLQIKNASEYIWRI